MKRLRRSTVLIPGNVPEFLGKSRKLEADVLLFDLQDAIARLDAAKLEARQRVVAALGDRNFRARELCVRVNSPGSPWVADDIKAVVQAGADSIMLSHGYSAADVGYAEGCVYSAAPTRKVDVLIEVDTPGMLADLDALARTSTMVTGLSIASGDYALELGAQAFGPDRASSEDWLAYCRARVLSVARWKGWNACDLVNPGVPDPDALTKAMRASRGLGFDGVALLMPRHIPIANAVFGVSAAELAWAQALVEGWKKLDDGPDWNKGARVVNGQMVVAPVYEYACRVLTLHAVIGGDPAATQRFRASGLASAEYLMEKRA